MSRQSWTEEQDTTITRLVQEIGLNDWSQVASSLKENYPFSKRTGKQCRERWYNHLSPTVSKLPWTSIEQQKLFEMHKVLGNRWKDISKLFPGRTDNDIKNHFYSTLRRSLRRLNKILGQRNSTSQMREIKPSVLTTIMSFNYGNPDKLQRDSLEGANSIKDLPSLIFEFANFKPIKKSPSPINIDDVKDKIGQIFELISQFNQQYQDLKFDRRKTKGKKAERVNSKQQNIVKVIQKQQNSFKVELQKDILTTQVWIKEEDNPIIDHFEFMLEQCSQEEKIHAQPHLQQQCSQLSLQAQEDILELGDPQEPSRISQDEDYSMIMKEHQFLQYDYEIKVQEDIWADQIHL